MNKNWIVMIVFVIMYLILFILNYFKIFGVWDSIFYYFGIFGIFFLTYWLFEILQKEVSFKFDEAYIGFILLVLLYIGFWLGFRIYFGNVATLNNKSFADLYTVANMNIYKTIINGPYIYLALSSFFGWLAFYITKKTK